MPTRYEVTTVRVTPKARLKSIQVVEASGFTQNKRTARFTDERGGAIAVVKHVARVCWP
jgi:hypothetical protein